MPFTEAQREKVQALLEPLQQRYPALHQGLPLALDTKKRIPALAVEFGVAHHLIMKALNVLTDRSEYQRALAAPKSMRHTLEGVPVEPVSDDHRAYAQTRLDSKKPKKPTLAPTPVANALPPALLREILTMAIPGKLDVTLKINQLPVVKSLGPTVAFAVNADGRTVLVELKNKAWNTLKTTAESYPQWVAAITGKLGEAIEGGFRLENPAVQIFEKKPKPDAAVAPPATEPKATEPKASEPPAPPATGRPRLSLKGRTLRVG